MFLAGNALFSSFAIGTILVVAVAVLGSVTVLPATLAALGGWVDRPAFRCCGASIAPGGRRASGLVCCARSWPGLW